MDKEKDKKINNKEEKQDKDIKKETKNKDVKKKDTNEIITIETETETENKDEIVISGDVIATVAGVAIADIDGVRTSSGFFENIPDLLKSKSRKSKGIKVEINKNTVKIDISIIVEYGIRIPDVAFEIQVNVKKAVEAMTGLRVKEVNVHVQGIQKTK